MNNNVIAAKSLRYRKATASEFRTLISGADLRELRGVENVIALTKGREEFEALFKLLYSDNRIIAMRAADAIEKLTRSRPELLAGHQVHLLHLLRNAVNKELKWHLAQLVTRVKLENGQRRKVWNLLNYWASNPNESKIVRVNALQGLYELSFGNGNDKWQDQFRRTLAMAMRQRIPSISARARKLLSKISAVDGIHNH